MCLYEWREERWAIPRGEKGGGYTEGREERWAIPRGEKGGGLYRGGRKGEVALQRGVARVHRCVGRRC